MPHLEAKLCLFISGVFSSGGLAEFVAREPILGIFSIGLSALSFLLGAHVLENPL